MGAPGRHPESISLRAMVEVLIADLPPERMDTAAALAVHRASARWSRSSRPRLLVRGGGRGPAAALNLTIGPCVSYFTHRGDGLSDDGSIWGAMV